MRIKKSLIVGVKRECSKIFDVPIDPNTRWSSSDDSESERAENEERRGKGKGKGLEIVGKSEEERDVEEDEKDMSTAIDFEKDARNSSSSPNPLSSTSKLQNDRWKRYSTAIDPEKERPIENGKEENPIRMEGYSSLRVSNSRITMGSEKRFSTHVSLGTISFHS
jgi:hypothetical protein